MSRELRVPPQVVNFIFNEEGMGGFINYTGATTWLAQNQPHVHGRVWCEQFLVPLLKDIHEPFKNWQVLPTNQFERLVQHGTPTIGPSLTVNGRQEKRQFLTALGCHPFDVGFAYYLSTCPAPKGAYLPVLDYPDSKLPPKIKKLNKNYVVLTTGGTTPVRTMRAKDINPIIAHVKSLGLTPVFLGKKDILLNGKRMVNFDGDTDFASGVDMRDQTTVKDAACIMQHAKCTVGVDGGNLHLASLMKDSRIVFGYNITTIEHREPRRNHGKIVNIAPTKEELSCTGCQSEWKHLYGHTFDKCLFGDIKCLDVLFSKDSIKFKNAIDEVLK